MSSMRLTFKNTQMIEAMTRDIKWLISMIDRKETSNADELKISRIRKRAYRVEHLTAQTDGRY